MKKLSVIITAILVLAVFQTPLHARNGEDHGEMEELNTNAMEDHMMDSGENMMDEAMETTEATTEEITSFELFWPIVAGKTRGEPLYFLKKLKEKVRGALIFGDAKDADYNLFLATKRVVEAEKLITEDKHELAKETINDALENISEARDEWEDVENKDVTEKHELNNKLNNLELFLPQLVDQTSNEDLKNSISKLLQNVTSLNESI